MSEERSTSEALHVFVRLTIRDAVALQEFESAAVGIMNRYGGHLLSAFEVEREEGEVATEVHLLEFPDRRAFDAYRQDGELLMMQQLRSMAISHSEVLLSSKLKHY